MSLIFLGDVMIGRFINHENYIHQNVLEFLQTADVRICNLECVITSKCPSIETVKSLPNEYICKHGVNDKQKEILKELDINLCNLANNHILDYNFDGVKDTIHFLNTNKIRWFGFGKNYDVACKPRVYNFNINEVKRIKIGFFGVSDHFVEWNATENLPGINYFDIQNFTDGFKGNLNRSLWENIENVYNIIKQVRDKCDLIVFSIHWGNNFQDKICAPFKHFAHKLIDHGVDIIHGHSSHHVQEIEIYSNRLIMYGCGEFLNDYELMEAYLNRKEGSLGPEYVTYKSHLSYIYKLHLKAHEQTISLSELELYPIEIKDGVVRSCTDEDDVKWLFDKALNDCDEIEAKCFEKERRIVFKLEGRDT